jgi:hypothetical protein
VVEEPPVLELKKANSQMKKQSKPSFNGKDPPYCQLKEANEAIIHLYHDIRLSDEHFVYLLDSTGTLHATKGKSGFLKQHSCVQAESLGWRHIAFPLSLPPEYGSPSAAAVTKSQALGLRVVLDRSMQKLAECSKKLILKQAQPLLQATPFEEKECHPVLNNADDDKVMKVYWGAVHEARKWDVDTDEVAQEVVVRAIPRIRDIRYPFGYGRYIAYTICAKLWLATKAAPSSLIEDVMQSKSSEPYDLYLRRKLDRALQYPVASDAWLVLAKFATSAPNTALTELANFITGDNLSISTYRMRMKKAIHWICNE